MSNLRTKFVAVEYNENGSCKKVLSCVNLTESEYNKLVNESLESKQHGLARLEKQRKDMTYCKEKILAHDYLLAKSLYDSYVNRGEFELYEKFEQDFKDYLLNGGDFPSELPTEYEQILNKLGGEKDE